MAIAMTAKPRAYGDAAWDSGQEGDPGPRSTSQYATFTDSKDAIQSAARFLEVTPYRLRLLLDINSYEQFAKIYKGDKRLSQRYFVRLTHLIQLKARDRLDISTFNPQEYWVRLAAALDASRGEFELEHMK